MHICKKRPICGPNHWLFASSVKMIRQPVHTTILRNPSLTCSICASILDSLSESFCPSAASKATCIALQILFLQSNKLRIFAFLVPLQLWSSELQYVRRGCVLPPRGLSKPLSYSSQSSCKEEAMQTQNICENKMCVYIMALKIFVIILT